jgi:hypothetical protein
MAFSDDIQALKVRADAINADRDAINAQLTAALFTRLRSAPALEWMTDDGLRQACQAFAGVAVRQVVPPAPLIG